MNHAHVEAAKNTKNAVVFEASADSEVKFDELPQP
jgi:hypothetical protein